MESGVSDALQPASDAPFAAGALVLVTLHSPKEKFWGALLELTAAGVSVCGVDLNSFEDFTALMKTGEASPSTVFFPMHRVERIETDARSGPIPAIAEQFEERTGREAHALFLPARRRSQR